MRGNAVVGGIKNYLLSLIAVIVFPVVWAQSLRLARHHADTDPRGVPKVAVGIVLGVLLAGGGLVYTINFQADAVDGMYDTLDGRLSIALGNEGWRAATDEGRTADAAALAGNHDLYEAVSAAVADHDDLAAKILIAGRDRASLDDGAIDEKKVDRAFVLKDQASSDLATMMTWFVYPGLIGAFYAPLVWALGNVVRSSWEPSETVGFKPYPHKSAGTILLLGAFGVPAVLFSAWIFQDLRSRSSEGQIAL